MATNRPAGWLAPGSSKALVERAWLLHTVFWVAVMAVIMVAGLASTWTDVPLMVLGVSLALTTYLAPLAVAAPADRPTVHAMFAGCLVLSLGMNYYQTPFFFDVLHMKFGFLVEWRIDRNPIFLYFLTVPYFATYQACGCVAYRICRRALRSVSWLPKSLASAFSIVIIAISVAFFETLLNGNPFISNLFCYDDAWLALTFGSACYGVSFMLSLPVWMWVIPEDSANVPSTRSQASGVPLWVKVAFWNLAVVFVDAAILAIIAKYVAPSFTTVVPGALPSGGCLTPEPQWKLW